MRRTARIRPAAALVLGAAALLAPPAAHAALRFTPCSGEIPGECTHVQVPLDRTGAIPGTVSLLVRRTTTGGAPSRGAVLAIAGGPGQSATGAFGESYVSVLGPLLDGHDFLTMDVRGSGGSGALRCAALQTARQDRRAAAAAQCARVLGPRRSLYTTRDNVQDIEAVRQALGIDRLTLFGVSYGTKVALAYAEAYPTHVERLLLDSVVLPEGPDPLYRPTFAALHRVLGALCSAGACRGITRNLPADVATLAARLRRRPLRGLVFGADGRPRRAALDEAGLFSVLLDGDEILSLRSDVPAAVRSALRGDPAPILRLTSPDLASRGSSAATAAAPDFGVSEALFAATSCEEMPFPWSRTAPVADRPAQLRRALDAQPLSAFAPFGRDVPPQTDFLRTCSGWPVRPDPPALTTGPLPAVPALILEGSDDIRTPVEQARIALRRLPQGRMLTVQATGHNVTGGDTAHCVTVAIARWARGQSTATRCRRRRADPITPILPRRLADVAPARGTRGRPGRTLAAVIRTLDDLAVQRSRFFSAEGGLRGGRFRSNDAGATTLTRLSLVEGVTVTGTLGSQRATLGRLRIAGRAAARGTLTLRGDGRLNGVLGGRRVRGCLPGAAARVLRNGG